MAVTFSDTFTDTDGTLLTDHVPDVNTAGGGWTRAAGLVPYYIITSNKAAVQTNSGTYTFDAGAANGVYSGQAVVVNFSASRFFANFRRVDANNEWRLRIESGGTAVRVYKTLGGVSTNTQYSLGFTLSTSFSWSVDLNGSNITVTISDGSNSFTAGSPIVDSDHGSATIMGFNAGGSATYTSFDNIQFDAAATDFIDIGSPKPYQVIQRTGSTADIEISGAYSGTPAAVEARFDGGSWTTIDASPSGGTYSGTLTSQSGQGTLEVRFANDTAINNSISNVGVGDVFVIAGQSNAEGRLTNDQDYAGSLIASMFTEADNWVELQDPSDSDSTDGSVWPLLTTLHMADQGVPVAFITTADGATGLSTPDAHWKVGGSNYTNAIAQVTASGVNGVKAVLYFQGERDVVNGVSQSTYHTDLVAMAAGFAAAMPGSPPTIVAVINEATGTDAEIDEIRAAQIQGWADANILPGPVTVDVDLSAGDSLHFATDAEGELLADRWWLAIDGAFFGGSYGTAPRIVSATYVDDIVTLTYDQDLAAGTTYGGYTFLDDASPIIVTTATRAGTRAVELDLASIPSGTVKKAIFASGRDAHGEDVPTNVGGMPAAPEEFEVVPYDASSSVSGGVSQSSSFSSQLSPSFSTTLPPLLAIIGG